MEKNNIILVGEPSAGRSYSIAQALAKHDVDVVVNDFARPEPLLYTKLPDLVEPYIDYSNEIANYKKHKQTCAKNRKARKKKRK